MSFSNRGHRLASSSLAVTLFFCLLCFVYLYDVASQRCEAFAQSTPIAGDDDVAQNATNNATLPFSTYQDPIYGIKIQYPSDWNKTEGANFLEFRLPTEGYNRTNITDLIALEIRIDILPPDMVSLEPYSRAKLISHRQYGEFSLLESNTTTIAANVPALKTVYTNTFPKTGEVLKTMEITAIKDRIGYDIRYFADPASDYSRYLPLVQKMIDSFEFIGFG